MKRSSRYASSAYSKGRWMIECERLGLPLDTPVPVGDELLVLSEGISDWLKQMGVEEEAWMAQLLEQWGEIAGAQVAQHTRPGRMRSKTLVVYVDSSVWLNELSRYGQKRLLANIIKMLPESPIDAVQFQLDPDGGR